MDKNEGGPAFPVVGMSQRNGQEFSAVFNGGMTLRDYFACEAMKQANWYPEQLKLELAAQFSYQIADAMLGARNK